VSSSTRQTWDETWLEVARVIAKRSLCERDQVGAVIVSKDNRIVATGYNGPPAGFDHSNTGCSSWCYRAQASDPQGRFFEPGAKVPLKSDYSDCPSLHAEANALSVCDRSVREGGTIYITSGVCFGCAKLIANSGLEHVIVPRTSYEHGHRDTEKSYRFLESVGVTVVVIG
jgi:dCMP deaminase